MAKATVQAALGPVAMDSVRTLKDGDPEDKHRAEITLLICVLSILMTAPFGAIIITLSGPRLLTKTTSPPPITEWRRRSHRPSIRDISIIDEEEEIESSNNYEDKNQKQGAQLDDVEIHEIAKKESVVRKEGENLDTNENKS